MDSNTENTPKEQNSEIPPKPPQETLLGYFPLNYSIFKNKGATPIFQNLMSSRTKPNDTFIR